MYKEDKGKESFLSACSAQAGFSGYLYEQADHTPRPAKAEKAGGDLSVD